MSSPKNDQGNAKRPSGQQDIKRLLRIRVPVIAVLAEKHMKLAEVLNFNVGSIIQLNKPSDDLLDLMVNDQRVGRGETVRAGDNFGLQLVEIGPVQDTIRKLGLSDEAKPKDESPAESAAEGTPAKDDTAKPDA